jgi:hypothetical protein
MSDTRTTRRLGLAGLFALVAASYALLAAVAQPAGAHSVAGTPYHSSAGAQCYVDAYYGNSIRIYPPRDMRPYYTSTDVRYLESVVWQAALYKYDPSTGTWRVVATQPRLYAAVNPYGIQYLNGGKWFTRPDRAFGSQIGWLRFPNLGPGSYAVQEGYAWLNGAFVHYEFASFSWNYTTSTICTI